MCADRWDANWSDHICLQMGYSRQIQTWVDKEAAVDEGQIWIKRDNASLTPEPVQLLLELGESSECETGKRVGIECSSFGKIIILIVFF